MEKSLQPSKNWIPKLDLKLIIVIIIFHYSCQENQSSEKEPTKEEAVSSLDKSYDKKHLYSLIEKGINEGDTVAYKKAFEYTLINGGSTEFFYYAQLMANKHNYGSAYKDLYRLLTSEGIKINGVEIYSADTETQRLANYYLLKSYELGVKSSKATLFDIFGENIPKSSDYLCKSNK